jgi:hypothetical protein
MHQKSCGAEKVLTGLVLAGAMLPWCLGARRVHVPDLFRLRA